MGKANEEAKRIKASLAEAKEEMDDLLFASRDFTEEAKKSAKAVYENSEAANATTAAFRGLSKITEEIAGSVQASYEGNLKLEDLAKKQEKLAKSKIKFETEYRQALGKARIDQADINKLVKGQGDLTKVINDNFEDLTAEQIQLLESFNQQRIVLKDQDKIFGEMVRKAKNLDNATGVFGKTLKGSENVLKKMGLGKLSGMLGIEKAIKDGDGLAKKLTDNGDKVAGIGTKARVAGKMMASMGGSLLNALSPLLIMKQLFNAIKSVDKAAGDFAKNMGMSYNSAIELRKEYAAFAKVQHDSMVSSKSMMEAQTRLNSEFGTSVKFGKQMAADMASLEKRTKMTADTQKLIARETILTGKSAKTVTKEINAQVHVLNHEKGLQMSVKQIQDAIGKSSKSIQMNFKGSTIELTKQVMSAKALGTNLAGVEKIASSLLDFESSIQAELEAELLLGKQINLESARRAALEGDMAKVADEVMRNKAIMNAFETKNVIAQEAAAKALGMNREELASMIQQQQDLQMIRDAGFESMDAAQEAYNAKRAEGLTAEEAAQAVGAASLQDQLESVSKAEELQAIMERVQEVFVELAVPVLKFIEGLGSAEDIAAKITGYIEKAAYFYGAIKATQIAMKAMQGAMMAFEAKQLALKTAQAGAAVTAASAATLGLGAIAIIAAVGAVMAAVGGFMADDAIIPGTKSGYGSRVLLGPEGAISFNNKDTIVAGTDLYKEADDAAFMGEGSISMGEPQDVKSMEKKLDNIHNELKEMNENYKESRVVLTTGGEEIGNLILMGSRLLQ